MTTLPPSSGSTGIRLKAPITGPAHHTAAAASVLPRLDGVERVDAHRRSSTSSPAVMWVSGPARAMPASVRRESGSVVVYEA